MSDSGTILTGGFAFPVRFPLALEPGTGSLSFEVLRVTRRSEATGRAEGDFSPRDVGVVARRRPVDPTADEEGSR